MPMSAHRHVQPENHDATLSDDDAAPAVRSFRMVNDAWESRECGSDAFLDFLTPCAALLRAEAAHCQITDSMLKRGGRSVRAG